MRNRSSPWYFKRMQHFSDHRTSKNKELRVEWLMVKLNISYVNVPIKLLLVPCIYPTRD